MRWIFGGNEINEENMFMLKIVSISIVFVFVVSNIINYMLDSVSAKKMMKELEEFQNHYNDAV